MATKQQRIQVDTGAGIPTPAFQPAAQPSDTFVRPGVAPVNEAGSRLAQALSGLAPALAHFGDVLGQKNNANDVAVGAQRARDTVAELDASRTSYADAVKQGRIGAIDNPWMKQGYYEELGRTYAGRLQSDLTLAVDAEPALQSTIEVADYRKFASDFETDWMAKNVPDEVQNSAFTTGYGNRRDAILQNMENGWAAGAEDRFTKQNVLMFRDQSVNFIEQALDSGQSLENISGYLKQSWDDKHAIGWQGGMMGNALVDAISDVATARRDPALMEKLLSKIPGGVKGSTLQNTGYAHDIIEKTKLSIAQDRRVQWEDEAHTRQEASRGIKQNAATLFAEANAKDTPKDKVNIFDLQKAAIQNGDPDLADQLQAQYDAYQNKDYVDNKDRVAGLMMKLHAGPYVLKQAELNTALTDKDISLPTYSNLSNALEQAQKEAKNAKVPSILDDDDLKFAISQVKLNLGGSIMDMDTQEVGERKRLATAQMVDWYLATFKNPNAPFANVSLGEKAKMIAQQVTRVSALNVNQGDEKELGVLATTSTDWKKQQAMPRPMLTEIMDNVRQVLFHKGNPTPQTVSVLQALGIKATDTKTLLEFYVRQNAYLPFDASKENPTNAPAAPAGRPQLRKPTGN